MTKQQLNVRVADLTTRQLDRLITRMNMTKGEVVMLAVDRMYRESVDEWARPEQGDSVRLVDVEDQSLGIVVQDGAMKSLIEFPADPLSGAQWDREWYSNARLEIVKRRA